MNGELPFSYLTSMRMYVCDKVRDLHAIGSGGQFSTKTGAQRGCLAKADCDRATFLHSWVHLFATFSSRQGMGYGLVQRQDPSIGFNQGQTGL